MKELVFFRPICAKTRLQANVISKHSPGVIPRTLINKGKEGGAEGKGEAWEGTERRKRRMAGGKSCAGQRHGKQKSWIITGGCSITSGG
jgi:hypothetical protein